MDSRGDILRELRQLQLDYLDGRISLKALGQCTYVLNQLLGTHRKLHKATVRLSKPARSAKVSR